LCVGLHLRIVLLDLFAAGTETSSTTLLWAVLFMTKFPQVLKKLHTEVDNVIGRERLPERNDKQKMPYLEAFTNEVHRKCSLLPMGVYHAITEDLGGWNLSWCMNDFLKMSLYTQSMKAIFFLREL
jgi:cytochrome P450